MYVFNTNFWNGILSDSENSNSVTEAELKTLIKTDQNTKQFIKEVTLGLPTDEIETTYGVCKCCEIEPEDSELANGLCIDCWDSMVTIMPDYCNYDPSLKLWIEYGKPVLA